MIACFRPGGDGHDVQPGQRSISVVVGIKGLGNDDFVPGIGHHVHREGYSFRSTTGDNDLFGGQLDMVVREIITNGLSQLGKTVRRPICQNFFRKIPHAGKKFRRRGDIRLTDIKVVHMGPPGLGSVGHSGQLPDGRFLDALCSF